MKRNLVLTDEARRHPFRISLPRQRDTAIRNDDNDLKLFVLSFAAFFVCLSTFLL